MKIIYDYKGNDVICDKCSTDFTNNNQSGGMVIGHWAYCPSCALEMHRKGKVSKRPKPIYCPINVSFRDFILNGRKKS